MAYVRMHDTLPDGGKHSPFLVLTDQRNVWLTLSPTLRLTGVLRTIKDVYFARHSLCCNEVWILGHITRSVDFTLVVDFLYDLDARLWWDRMATELPTFVVIVRTIQII